MPEHDMADWNRSLVEQTIAVLESSRDETAEAISRLRGFLAVNPGGPQVPRATEHNTEPAGE